MGRRAGTTAIGVGLVALAGSSLVAKRGLPQWEAEVCSAVNGTPDTLTVALWPPMQLGAGATPLILGAALARLGAPRRVAIGVAATGIGAWVGAKGVKHLIQRGRPAQLIPGIRVRAGGTSTGRGFVSGHAAVAAAMAVTADAILPAGGRAAIGGLAGVVGFARVQNGSHLPLDVVGGAGLGLALGGAWRALTG